MKSTLADNKQLFNVKAIAAAGLTPEAIPEGQLGIIDVSTGMTVKPANFAALPKEISLISKLGGRVYYSFDVIKKENIRNAVKQDYKEPEINIWSTTVKSCNCMEGVMLVLNIDEASLIDRDGLTWTHRDFIVEVAPQELKCYCDCSGKNPEYENNVLTKVLVEKIEAVKSPFYEAEARIDLTGVTSGAGAPPTSGEEGDVYLRNGATAPGLYANDGTVWVLVGDVNGIITDMEAFVETFKGINTDEDSEKKGPLLELVIKGKQQEAPDYHDIEVNYTSPRGVRLNPALLIDGLTATKFVEEQELAFELNSGYDLRAEEWENFNYYTNLNYYTRLSCGLPNPKMVYQFENDMHYNVVNFEFFTDKVERNNGDKRLFGVLLAASETSVYNDLQSIFIE